MSFLIVAVGGFLGAILRFFLANLMNKRIIGTWVANISGSFLLAFLLKWRINGEINDTLWLFLGVGFCGAYTTFSTFGNETVNYILQKAYWKAGMYILHSLLFSLAAVYLIYHVV